MGTQTHTHTERETDTYTHTQLPQTNPCSWFARLGRMVTYPQFTPELLPPLRPLCPSLPFTFFPFFPSHRLSPIPSPLSPLFFLPLSPLLIFVYVRGEGGCHSCFSPHR